MPWARSKKLGIISISLREFTEVTHVLVGAQHLLGALDALSMIMAEVTEALRGEGKCPILICSHFRHQYKSQVKRYPSFLYGELALGITGRP